MVILSSPQSLLSTKTAFILLVCLSTILCADYHFDKSVKFNTDNTIVSATAVKDDTLAIQSTHSSESVVTLLEGSSYNKQTLEFTSAADQSQIRATTRGIFINDGVSLTQKKINRQNLTFTKKDSFSVFSKGTNMIVNSQYALTGKFDQKCPSLRLVNLATLEEDDITYDSVDHWSAFAETILAEVGNGDIIFAKGYEVFILHQSDLQEYQEIDSAQYGKDIVNQIATYFDPATTDALLLVGRYRDNYDTLYYTVWRKNHSTQEYDDVSGFYLSRELSGPIFATGIDSAITISGYQINYWNNVKTILHQNFIDDDQILGIIPLAVSYGQTFFISTNNTGFLSIYIVDIDYQVDRKDSIFITTDQIITSQITSDDKQIFFLTTANTIYKATIFALKFLPIVNQYTNPNTSDFQLFGAQLYRFVTAVSINESYYFQLRNTANFGLVNQFKYNTNETNLSFNLVGNVEWGTIFAVSITSANTTTVETYRIDADVITLVNSTQQPKGSSIYASSNYILVQQSGTSTLKAYTINNFTLSSTITIAEFTSFSIEADKNILIISDNVGSKKVIYDLDVSFSPRGSFYVSRNAAFNNYSFIIFPKTGLYYQAAKMLVSEYEPAEVMYDIQLPFSTRASVTIETTNKTKDQILFYPGQNSGTPCNFIFYVQYDSTNASANYNPYLVRYSECSQTLDRYPIDTNQAVFSSKVFVSSDGKYVICGVKFLHDKYFLVELRQASNISSIIIRQNVTVANYAYALNSFDIDVTADNKLIINSPDTVTFLELESQRFSQNYGVASIISFDVSLNSVTAVVGVSLTNPLVLSIVVKNQSSAQIIFNQNLTNTTIQSIAISPQGGFIAYLTINASIEVWSVANQTKILTTPFLGLSFKFVDEENLLLQFSANYLIFNFINFTANTANQIPISTQFQQILSQSTTYIVAVSNDGSLIAVVQDNVVTIYEKNGNYVATYVAPLSANETIISTSFSPSNNLVVTTSAGNIYLLSATSCAPGTLLSDNLNCIACQFPCKYCSGSTTSCTEYQVSFYILVILGPLVLISIMVVIIVCIKKRRSKEDEEIAKPLKGDS